MRTDDKGDTTMQTGILYERNPGLFILQ